MKKTYLEIDQEALDEAQKILGTATMKETVNTALVEVAQRIKRLRAFDELRELAVEGAFDHMTDKRAYRNASPDWSPYRQDDIDDYDARHPA